MIYSTCIELEGSFIPYLYVQPSKHVEDIIKLKYYFRKGAFCWFILYKCFVNFVSLSHFHIQSLQVHSSADAVWQFMCLH